MIAIRSDISITRLAHTNANSVILRKYKSESKADYGIHTNKLSYHITHKEKNTKLNLLDIKGRNLRAFAKRKNLDVVSKSRARRQIAKLKTLLILNTVCT